MPFVMREIFFGYIFRIILVMCFYLNKKKGRWRSLSACFLLFSCIVYNPTLNSKVEGFEHCPMIPKSDTKDRRLKRCESMPSSSSMLFILGYQSVDLLHSKCFFPSLILSFGCRFFFHYTTTTVKRLKIITKLSWYCSN